MDFDLDIPEKPFQPKTFKFPKRLLGKNKKERRSFQPHWFEKWEWLHYDSKDDVAFCHWCMVCGKLKVTRSNTPRPFVDYGHSDWTTIWSRCYNHEKTYLHRRAVVYKDKILNRILPLYYIAKGMGIKTEEYKENAVFTTSLGTVKVEILKPLQENNDLNGSQTHTPSCGQQTTAKPLLDTLEKDHTLDKIDEEQTKMKSSSYTDPLNFIPNSTFQLQDIPENEQHVPQELEELQLQFMTFGTAKDAMDIEPSSIPNATDMISPNSCNNTNSYMTLRILLLGDDDSCKFSLIARFKETCQDYSDDCIIMNVDGVNVQYFMKTISSSETDPDKKSLLYSNTDVILLLFLADTQCSVDSIQMYWVGDVKQYCPQASLILIGNTENLSHDDGKVSKHTGEMLAKSIGAFRYVECSVSKNEGIAEIFDAVI